jgi:tetratricopeptide (TPR) repeat protein
MRFRYAIAGLLLTSFCAFAQQQTSPNAPSTPPNAPSAQPQKNCSWSAKKGGSGKWESSSTCTPSQNSAQEAGQNTPTAVTPDKNSALQSQQTPEEANPFPEAQADKAQQAANAATGKSSSSSSSSSSSHVDLDRLNAPEGSLARISNGQGGYIHDPAMAKHDDKVGNFYLQTGDYKGAYDRFKEATLVAPEDGNAVFGLAQAAQGLHRTQEAATNYTIYLDAFPNGKKTKDARKALSELTKDSKK